MPTIKTLNIYFENIIKTKSQRPQCYVLEQPDSITRRCRLIIPKATQLHYLHAATRKGNIKSIFKGETSQSYRICITVYRYRDQLLHKDSPIFNQHN